MKKVLFVAFVLFSFFAKSQTWNNVSGRWGYEWLRNTKALFIPSGNGAPSGTASLQGAGYKGQAALYSDTTNKKIYLFNPKDSTWTDITSGGGGGTPSGPAGGDLAGTYPNPTIGANAVTNAKAAQMGAHTYKGNNTGSTANAADITATQLTAELNVFGSGLKGLVPAAAGSPSATKFLSETGVFSIPSGGGADLQAVTTTGNTTTNDIIVGNRTFSAGRFSVEKTYTSLNVHSFDDYSTLTPSIGGFGFGVFDASTTMGGSMNNDHFIGFQARLNYTSSGTITGPYGMTGFYVNTRNTGSGTIPVAHGIYIEQVAAGGTNTDVYGIRIKPITSGANNYAISTEGGLNSFTGAAIFGNTITGAGDVSITGAHSYSSYGSGSPSSLTNSISSVMINDGTNSQFYTIGRGTFSSSVGDFVFSSYNGSVISDLFRIKASTGNFLIGTNTDNAIGKLQVNGKLTIATIDSSSAPANLLWQDPVTKEVKKTAVPVGGNYSFLDKQYTTTQNSGSSTTTMYTYTIPANKLTTDGDIIDFVTDGFLSDATTTPDLTMQFNGSNMLGTGAIAISGNVHYIITGRIIRTSSTTARTTTTITIGDGTGSDYVGNASYTSLDFTSGIVIRLLGTASGAGASTGDIQGHFWTVEFKR